MNEPFKAYVIGWILGCSFGAIAGYSYYLDISEQAIEKGFAEYNQSTGDWQWKEAKR
jgi:predicted acylesterase/phospholipase RssA